MIRKLSMLLIVLAICGGYFSTVAFAESKVLILGIDGLDPVLLNQYVGEGVMPNFAKLMQEGSYSRCGTTTPPQSPVAWATFATGTNPGKHGIFDFIHRDTSDSSGMLPGTPFLSTSSTVGGKVWEIGDWVIPITGGETILLRRGAPFWQYLTDKKIPATLFKLPSNYPPDSSATKAISGMGTPDMTGGYGSFSYYTDYPPLDADEISGGEVFPVDVIDNKVEMEIVGPRNELKASRPKLTVPFTAYLDPDNEVAKFEVGDEEFILKTGEWSEWIPVSFVAIPVFGEVKGICRFYLKSISPDFNLYMTPVNVDPANSVLPISYPASYAKQLAADVGPFYTQGMPEDTKALSTGILDDGEFIQQAKLVLNERLRLYDRELALFKKGLLFFYFSSLDQNTHMFWRTFDPEHPIYDPEESPKYAGFIRDLYITMDGVLAKTLDTIDEETTLLIMSDHGFAPFRRCFQINTWLKENGYVTLIDEYGQGQYEFFANVDWDNTRAYNLGINGIYVNLKGREAKGIVDPSEKDALLKEIADKLLQVRDPENGQQVLTQVDRKEDVYIGDQVDMAPDLILGFNRGYRASWETILGEFPLDVINDNEDKWSGDHCMAPDLVPGVFMSNKRLTVDDPNLLDFGPTVLAEFGIAKPEHMEGRAVLEKDSKPMKIKSVPGRNVPSAQ